MSREEITNNEGYAQEKANLEYIRQRQEHGVNDPYMITEIDEAFDAGYDKGYQYAQTHPNWISVKKELPPKRNDPLVISDEVFIHTSGGHYLSAVYDHQDKEWIDVYNIETLAKSDEVTHWMPIVPPKNDEKNE